MEFNDDGKFQYARGPCSKCIGFRSCRAREFPVIIVYLFNHLFVSYNEILGSKIGSDIMYQYSRMYRDQVENWYQLPFKKNFLTQKCD